MPQFTIDSIAGLTERHFRRPATRRGCAFAFACAITCAAPAATTQGLCGATIVEDLKLDQDLTCTGDGLIAGADGIRIDLNGHTITGSGTGAGVGVTGRADISISGGTITNFAVAVRTINSTEVVVKQNEFVGNSEGIDLQTGSMGNTIKDNIFRNSATRAIMLRTNSSDNEIKNNTFIGNRVGILVFGGVDNGVKHNRISESSLAGIRLNVIATGNLLKDNTITSNFAGVEFLVTATGSAVGNELKNNTIGANTCGVKGPTGGNNFTGNSFAGNGTDTCS